jgi:putative SOS response-associated peptidase YedK
MCGRFYIDGPAEQEIKRIARRTSLPGSMLSAGTRRDVHPTEKAAILSYEGEEIAAVSMRWGFPPRGAGQLLINARAETAMERPAFSESVLRRRCIIPAAGFYEWDRDKNKAEFYLPDEPCIFMAGMYNLFNGEDRFVILTTEANESMRPVHDRMPLILREDEITDWLREDDRTQDFLRIVPPQLMREQSYEQMSLFDMDDMG